MSNQLAVMTLRLPTELVRELDEASQRDRRSRTQQILFYVDEGLARDGEKARRERFRQSKVKKGLTP